MNLFGGPIPDYADGIYSIEIFQRYWPDRDFIEVQVSKIDDHGNYYVFDHKTNKGMELCGQDLYDMKAQFIRTGTLDAKHN
jgi:hypothetical protein